MRVTMNVLGKCFVLAAAIIWHSPMTLQAQTDNQSAAVKSQDEPKIVFESLAHDFGTVQQNSTLTHAFAFKNQGTAPLVIEKVSAG